MKLNLKTVVLFFFTLSGLRQAYALTNEICTDQSGRIKIVIQQDLNNKIRHIELYEDAQLRVRDTVGAQYCHVDGAIYYGKIFSYGGCYNWGDTPARFLSWDKFFRSNSERTSDEITVDLNTFNCVFQ
ncbi:MAG TPA: hypothetical protein VIG33_12155 [Pseudobdellovibrionaceae bacterium]|jgi:hypothetical protein